MKVCIEIECENDALDGAGRVRELKRIMEEARMYVPELWLAVRARVREIGEAKAKEWQTAAERALMDINGNKVGTVSVVA